jgi:hypothetical protein
MSDHEFEKKIQLQMEELKFRPSEAVWMEVEKNIRRDKRRRRFLLWVPVAAGLLLTGGYLVFSSTRETREVLVNKSSTVQPAVPSTSSSQNSNGLSKENTTQENADRESSIVNRESATGSEESSNVNRESATGSKKPSGNNVKPAAIAPASQSDKTNAANGHAVKHNKGLAKKTPLVSDSKGNNTVSPPAGTEVVIDKAQQPVQDAVTSTRHPLTSAQHPAPINQHPADSTEEETAQLVALDSASSVAPMVTPIERKPKKGNKWQWGIQASGGSSNISTERLFGFSNPFSMEKSLVADVASNSPANMYAININPPANKKPSAIETGVAYSIGGFVQRSVARRLTLGVGLQYAHYSVRTKVGQRVDNAQAVNIGPQGSTIVEQFYRNSSPAVSHSYTYRYHFIELPVYVNWQINKARRLPPVAWHGGISVARLIGTNALHYDGVSGVYFKDNGLFNKTQVALTSGLEIGLFRKYRFPIWVGPSFGYNVTGLISKEVSSSQFLWTGGVRLKMLLKK